MGVCADHEMDDHEIAHKKVLTFEKSGEKDIHK